MPPSRLLPIGVGVLACLISAGACTRKPEPATERPNIVLILADDLGVEGLKSYGGSAYETPNLDRLAADGTRFEYAFATPICTPSRVELMTGQYPFRNGWTGMGGGEDVDTQVSPDLPSLGRILRNAGYATAVAGKWQLAPLKRFPDHPGKLGFDEYSLWVQGNSRYWAPAIIENGKMRSDLAADDDVYGPDVFSDFLIHFIERNRSKPFFIFYPMVLAHQPYTSTPDTVNDPANKAGKTFKTGNKRVMATSNAANVAYMDKLIGRLVDALELYDLRRRTILLFTADNGTSPLVASPRDGAKVAGGKAKMNDQGSSVPLIVSGPGIEQGQVRLEQVDFTDLLPTIAELARVPLPEDQKVDGRSFAPFLRGEKGEPRPWIYVQRAHTWFIRDGRWRLHEDGQIYDVTDRFSAKRIEPPLEGDAAAAHERLAREVMALHPEVGEVPQPSSEAERDWR